ncbi:MAG: DUF2283 domain-containing protein [Chloroflexi bacterium]|nr:DUF2283 domain-containing protein [Chloroflexota bacterium]MCH7652999.1 DUF2283 domain-containing protein [Chloroflexota bacterium]
MDVKYFPETDTLMINFSDKGVADTRDVNENLLIELDKDGNLVSMTIEHAKLQMDVENFSYQKIADIV